MVSQETVVGKTLKMPMSAIFGMFLHLTGPLVAQLFHILVEEVIRFEMSGLTSNRLRISCYSTSC